MKQLLVFLFWIPLLVEAQQCNLTMQGYVRDRSTNSPLSYATLKLVEDISKSTITDENGYFFIENLCPGEYHIDVSFVGFETERKYITLKIDTTLSLILSYHHELLSEVVIHGEKEENRTEPSTLVHKDQILQEANKNLADVVESLSGVSVLKTGSGISKPIIHGLYGNRITILNNGIPQAGQQWGNDHAPEIDPFVADHISVIKGSAALEYVGSSIGGVIMVEPEQVISDPHLHGNINYIFQSNGLGNTLNTKLEKSGKWASWRLSGTFKKMGDLKGPDYFLTNTGRREQNIALQIEKSNDNRDLSFYYSFFNTEIGILRGAHVGNLTDLQDAIGREEPFFTNSDFSYQINAPRQKVAHHLVKTRLKYFLGNGKTLEFKYAGQLNQRKEFDVRRSGRSDIPALSLDLYAHYVDGVFNQAFNNGAGIRSGIQFNLIDNANNPETGVLPLIPNYDSYNLGTFLIYQKEYDNLLYELGGRYDLKWINVSAISRTIPRIIENFNHAFQNISFSTGMNYTIFPNLRFGTNLGYAQRAPEVNEMHSFGLHQGVSGIEEGNLDLETEKSLKGILNVDLSVNDQLFLQALGYIQSIQDYIFLEPQNELRLTIRGAFPVFSYKQTDARLFGSDWSLTYEPNPSMKLSVVYAMVRGQDTENDQPLIYMPADNVNTTFSLYLRDQKLLKDNSFSLTSRYVLKQTRFVSEQDFQDPPGEYLLLGMNAGTHIRFKKSTLHFKFRIENMLNTSYRDYLNRQRYFADEMGFNLNVGINYSF